MGIIQNIKNVFSSTDEKIARIGAIEFELKKIDSIKDLLIDQHNDISKALSSDDFTCKDEIKFSEKEYTRELAKLKLSEKTYLKELDILKSNSDVFSAINQIRRTKASKFVKSLYKEGKLSLEQYNEASKPQKTEEGQVKYADVIVVNGKNEILLLKRAQWEDNHHGAWVIPGGHVDEGEDYETAAKRELREESGIDAEKLISESNLPGTYSWYHAGSYKDKNASIEYYCLMLRDLGTFEILLDEKETRDYLWVPREELDNYPMIFNMASNVKKVMGWDFDPQVKIIRKAVDLGIVSEDVLEKALSQSIYSLDKSKDPFNYSSATGAEWRKLVYFAQKFQNINFDLENDEPTPQKRKLIIKNSDESVYPHQYSVIASLCVAGGDWEMETMYFKIQLADGYYTFKPTNYDESPMYEEKYIWDVKNKETKLSRCYVMIPPNGFGNHLKENKGGWCAYNNGELSKEQEKEVRITDKDKDAAWEWLKNTITECVEERSQGLKKKQESETIRKAIKLGIIPIDKVNDIVKALGHKYLQKEPDGKGGYIYIYDNPNTKSNVKFDVGTTITDKEKGLDIQRYSDKAILIKGNTYANLDLLRKIKTELGVGNWNKPLNGWVFPVNYIDKILSYVISETKDEDKRDTLINTKNESLKEGDEITISGIKGKVEEGASDDTGIKYNIELENGTKLEGVSEKVIDVEPTKVDKEISEEINEVQPETRSKAIKELYGVNPIENIQDYTLKEFLDMYGLKDREADPSLYDRAITKHRDGVVKALMEGKDIKESVLDDYPDIKDAYTKKRQAMSEETKRKISEALKKHQIEQEVKAAFENMSEEDLNSLKSAFKEAYSDVAKEQQMKLAILMAEKAELESKPKDVYDRTRSSSLAIVNNKIRSVSNAIKALSNGGDLSSFEDKMGVTHSDVPDFTKVDTSDITYDIDSILTKDAPNYIPEINEDNFRQKGYILDAMRVGADTYLVAVNGHSEVGKALGYSSETRKNEYTGFSSEANGYVTMTLDQLVLTNDYYKTKQKARYQEEVNRKNKREEEYWNKQDNATKEFYLEKKNSYLALPAAIKKKITEEAWKALPISEKEKIWKPIKHHNAERLKTPLDEGQMWTSFHMMHERFIDPTAKRLDRLGRSIEIAETMPGSYANPIVSKEWNKFSEMLNWKLNDIKVQREVESDSYRAGLETSYGDSNTNDTLKDGYGILVKRQNGDEISHREIDEIKKAWEGVQKTFGSLKENANKDNLKISHSGEKYMFARNAAGLYIPKMKTIAATAKYGTDGLGFIIGHEVAHWIDNTIGKKNGKRFASDDYESTSGQIAVTLRRGMNEKTTSNYQNATHECFARALEQYNAIESGVDATSKSDMAGYFSKPNYVNKETYENKLKPLIQVWLAENKDILKSIDMDLPNGENDIEKAFSHISDLYIMDQIGDDVFRAAQERYDIEKGVILNCPSFSIKDKKDGDKVKIQDKVITITKIKSWTKNKEASCLSFDGINEDGEKVSVKYDDGCDGYIFEGQDIQKAQKEELIGGKADGKTLQQIAEHHKVELSEIEKQFEIGKKVEREHTTNEEEIEEIAKDHLMELSDYYTRLNKMEEEGEKQDNK